MTNSEAYEIIPGKAIFSATNTFVALWNNFKPGASNMSENSSILSCGFKDHKHIQTINGCDMCVVNQCLQVLYTNTLLTDTC